MSFRIDEFSPIMPGEDLHVKSWFCEKEGFNADSEAVITHETPKAYCCYLADDNEEPVWIPKSQVVA